MLKVFHEHTLDTALLRPHCKVLDVGCRGFAFGDALRQEFQANVYEVDIDDLGPDRSYYRCGIAQADGSGDVSSDQEPEARNLVGGSRFKVYTLDSFSRFVGVEHWDVLKLDCEGSEYGILWNLERPIATQISVEFHQHTEARRSQEFMYDLVLRLERWYAVRKHKFYGRGANSLNYWDSLFVLKSI